MSDKKISELSAASAVAAADTHVIVQGGVTKKVSGLVTWVLTRVDAALNGTLGATVAAAALVTTLGVSGLLTLTGGQIKFPATMVPSADGNTLDDYEEGSWTPAITFTTPGDLNVVYSAQSGEYIKIGRQVTLSMIVITSTFTHGTASGSLNISGMPFASNGSHHQGALDFQGITKANYTNFILKTNAASVLECWAGASAQNRSAVTAADMPSGGVVALLSTVVYFTA